MITHCVRIPAGPGCRAACPGRPCPAVTDGLGRLQRGHAELSGADGTLARPLVPGGSASFPVMSAYVRVSLDALMHAVCRVPRY
jgi:hypothetical protein